MDEESIEVLKCVEAMNRKSIEDIGRIRVDLEELKRMFALVKGINNKLLDFLLDEAKRTHDDLTSERIRQAVDRIHRETFPNKI